MMLGTVYQLLARSCFILSSYGLHMALAYLVHDMTDYGRLGVVFSLMAFSRTLLSNGIPQAIAREIASSPEQSIRMYSEGFLIQIALGLLVFTIYMAGTPIWCVMLADKALYKLILVSGLIIPFSAAFQIQLSWLNGNLRFGIQSSLLSLYAIMRIVFAIGFVALGIGVVGVFWGLLVATFVCMCIVFNFTPKPRFSFGQDVWKRLSTSLPYVLSSIGVIAILNFDLLMLKHFCSQDPMVGFYAGASNIGKLPFFALAAFATTILSVVSRALSTNDIDAARKHARRELSSLLVLLVICSTLVTATSSELLDFIYPSKFIVASSALQILFWASSGLAFIYALLSMYGALGKMSLATWVVLLCVPLQLTLGWLFIPHYGAEGVALANLITVLFGISILGIVLWRHFGSFLFGSTLLFCLPAALLTFAILTRAFPATPLWLLPGKLIVGAGIFIAVLYAVDHRARESVHRGARTIRARINGSLHER